MFATEAEYRVFERLQKIIIDRFGVDEHEISPRAEFFADFGASSIDAIEFIMDLEEHFGLEIPDEHAVNLRSVADVVKYVLASQR